MVLPQALDMNQPPLPADAAPEPIEIEPDTPLLDTPELKDNTPLVPAPPAFAVRIAILPLLLSVPSPLVSDIDPPVDEALSPAVTVTPPPTCA